jgi:hypothetical protein
MALIVSFDLGERGGLWNGTYDVSMSALLWRLRSIREHKRIADHAASVDPRGQEKVRVLDQ